MVRPKKHLGQHFLSDANIATKIAKLVEARSGLVCELGPGTGMLTQKLLGNALIKKLVLIEIDAESVGFLDQHFSDQRIQIVPADFLKINPIDFFDDHFTLVGNFPYNISSQVFFRVIENKSGISEVVCMIQKEVAERIVSPPGNKTYGILSVLLQSWYDIKYCFTVPEHVFVPPPKVKSAVIRLTRLEENLPVCDETMLYKVVKAGFNQRRKTLRNALKPLLPTDQKNIPYLDKRAEQLDKFQFAELARLLNPG